MYARLDVAAGAQLAVHLAGDPDGKTARSRGEGTAVAGGPNTEPAEADGRGGGASLGERAPLPHGLRALSIRPQRS